MYKYSVLNFSVPKDDTQITRTRQNFQNFPFSLKFCNFSNFFVDFDRNIEKNLQQRQKSLFIRIFRDERNFAINNNLKTPK